MAGYHSWTQPLYTAVSTASLYSYKLLSVEFNFTVVLKSHWYLNFCFHVLTCSATKKDSKPQ